MNFVTVTQHLSPLQQILWCLYMLAAVMLPMYHVPPILKYLRGSQGIGDACVRSECLQCCWRLPALLFAVFVAPSVPLVMSILLDMVGRAVRIWAMKVAQRRHAQDRILPVRVPGRFSELVSG